MNNNENFNHLRTTKETVHIIQKETRENLVRGPKPPLDDFRQIIDETISNVVFNKANTNKWISTLPEHRVQVQKELEKVANNFFAEYLRNNDDTSIFSDKERMEAITEYLLYNTANVKGLIKNEQDSIKLSSYTHYEFLNSFLHDDAFIAKELGMTIDDVKNTFTQSTKTHFAARNILNPMQDLAKVKHHLEVTLNDENIAQELGITPEESRETFTKSMRTRFAVNNIADPIGALKKVAHHIEVTLSNENIAKELDMSVEEVQQTFTKSTRVGFAIANMSNPMKGLAKMKHHLEVTLSDENIAQELGITPEEAHETFTKGMKNRFAVIYSSDPIEALRTVKHHLEVTLSDGNIAKELGMTIAEVQDTFTKSIKTRFSVVNISDPMKALVKMKKHLEVTLSDGNIAKELEIGEKEAQETFAKSMKIRLAMGYISDPIKGLLQAKNHLDTTLVDENIAQKLGLTVEEVRDTITQGMKTRFAIVNMADPIQGVVDFILGKITYSGNITITNPKVIEAAKAYRKK
jgi:DNA-directed RNA polymerase specialized sigma subunit